MEAILRDENVVMPVSTLVEGHYGVGGVCLSLPSIVNGEGVSRVLELQLTDAEAEGFLLSSDTLKARLESSEI